MYIIKEYNDRFKIYFKVKRIKLNPFSKDKYRLKEVDINGGVDLFTPLCPTFKTLEEAKDQIEKFKKEPKYHEL